MTPEDLIVLKLVAGRESDVGDVRGIVATQGSQLDLEAARRSLRECRDEDKVRLLERMAKDTAP